MCRPVEQYTIYVRAKVSPWVLYLSDTGGTLLERFNDEQVKMIQDDIDPPFWMKLFKRTRMK